MVERERSRHLLEGVGVRPAPVVAALALFDVVVPAEDVDRRHVPVCPDPRVLLREPRPELCLFLCRESSCHCGLPGLRLLSYHSVRSLIGSLKRFNPVANALIPDYSEDSSRLGKGAAPFFGTAQ